MQGGRVVEDAPIARLALSRAAPARHLAEAAFALQNPC
jgi:hypothetical protein